MSEPYTPLQTRKRRTHKLLIFNHTTYFLKMQQALKAAGYRIAGCYESTTQIHDVDETAMDFHLIVTDLNLLYMQGITTLKILRNKFPHVPIVVRHYSRRPEDIGEVYRWGARAYVLIEKDSDKQDHTDLIEAVDTVVNGGIYVPDDFAKDIVAHLVAYRTVGNVLRFRLTKTEYRILAYLYQGWPTEAIADHIDSPIRSVRTQISSIKRKLEITDARLWQLFINAEYPDCIRDLENEPW